MTLQFKRKRRRWDLGRLWLVIHKDCGYPNSAYSTHTCWTPISIKHNERREHTTNPDTCKSHPTHSQPTSCTYTSKHSPRTSPPHTHTPLRLYIIYTPPDSTFSPPPITQLYIISRLHPPQQQITKAALQTSIPCHLILYGRHIYPQPTPTHFVTHETRHARSYAVIHATWSTTAGYRTDLSIEVQ